MQADEFGKFRELMAGVHDFYAKDLSDFALSVWWEALKAYDLPVISQAMSRHITNPDTGQFMPKPADVVKMFAGRTQDRALMAWSKVDRAVRVIGPHETVAFDDPLIHRVLNDMGGWIGLSQKTEDEWPFVGKEFENRYLGYAMRGEIPEYPPTLIGISEAHNAKGGFRVDPPRLIGDQTKAIAVIENGREDVMLIGPARADVSALRLIEGDKEVA